MVDITVQEEKMKRIVTFHPLFYNFANGMRDFRVTL